MASARAAAMLRCGAGLLFFLFACDGSVLDVADAAREVAFGVLLHGPGELSGMDVEIRVVPPSVPTTARAR